MKTHHWYMTMAFFVVLLFVVDNLPIVQSEVYENPWGKLEIYPDTSTNIITQVQYCNFTSYVSDQEIDVGFIFDTPISNPDIWIWKNISHDVWVDDYGTVENDYTIYKIVNYTIVSNPEFVDFGDIPSNTYINITTSWDMIMHDFGRDWVICGFDSYEQLNDTTANFVFHYTGVVGGHYEQQYWFDWSNIKDKFTKYNDSVFYVREWMVKDRLYQFKWQYDVPLGSNGKWSLKAKKSSDPLDGSWRVDIDPWWNSNWLYSKNLTVSENRLVNYPINLTVWKNDGHDDASNNQVDCEGHCNDDFSDIRFIYNNNTVVHAALLNYTSGVCSEWRVNLSASNYSYFEMYYGNATASLYSEPNKVFYYWHNYSDEIGNWTEDSTATYQGGTLTRDNTVAISGSYSARQVCNDASRSSFSNNEKLSTGKALEFWMYVSSDFHLVTTQDQADRSSTHEAMYLEFQTDTDIAYYDGIFNNIGTWAADTWYHLTLSGWDYANDQYDIMIRNTAKAKIGSKVNAGFRNNLASSNYHLILDVSTGTSVDTFFDNHLIRLHRPGEPQFSKVGNEQGIPNTVPVITVLASANGNTTCSIPVYMEVSVSDVDLDALTIVFYSNMTGLNVSLGEAFVDKPDGSYGMYCFNFSKEYSSFTWYANVSDGVDTVSTEWQNVKTSTLHVGGSSGGGGSSVGGVRGLAVSALGLAGLALCLGLMRRRKS